MKVLWIALSNLRRMFRVRTNFFFVFVFPMVLILVLGRWLPRIPAVLVAVLVAIGATVAFDLADHGVSLVACRECAWRAFDSLAHPLTPVEEREQDIV